VTVLDLHLWLGVNFLSNSQDFWRGGITQGVQSHLCFAESLTISEPKENPQGIEPRPSIADRSGAARAAVHLFTRLLRVREAAN
jgi:hypothetical protein